MMMKQLIKHLTHFVSFTENYRKEFHHYCNAQKWSQTYVCSKIHIYI